MREPLRAGSDRVPAIAEMLGEAFADDPLFSFVAGDPGDRASRRAQLFELWDTELAKLGCVWEIGDADAAAVWISPGDVESWAGVDESTRASTRPLIGGDVEGWDAMWDWIAERIPDEPLWFLDHIGVRPEMQGAGFGRALIEHGFRAADEDGLSAFLETAAAGNVAYYERLGFRVVEHGDAPLGGPHVWFMRRDP